MLLIISGSGTSFSRPCKIDCFFHNLKLLFAVSNFKNLSGETKRGVSFELILSTRKQVLAGGLKKFPFPVAWLSLT